MAKSKNGGTRAYIRGRIGSDVYSVGKNGKGIKQQVVRSLAEQVSNPRTESQMFGRMIMSTVMQAVSALKPIIDHSFDGLPAGQPSISEFIRQNYALVKADAKEHPASGNLFMLNKFQQKGILYGPWAVSTGSAVLPTAVTATEHLLKIALGSANATIGDLKSALGLSSDGFLTWVGVPVLEDVRFVRVHLNADLADTTVISAENVQSLFTFDGNITPSVSLTSNTIQFMCGDGETSSAYAVIVSEKSNGAWIHNNAVLNVDDSYGQPANEVLPTYPTGTQMFLNGGDL